jgi:hypothetical protein
MKPILRDFPDFFETERLLLRAPRLGDGVSVYQAIVETLDDLRAWPASLPWALLAPSADESEVFCRQGHSAFLARANLPMLMFLRGSNTFVGSTGLHRINWSVPKFEIGYWVRKSFHGQGLATESTRGIATFAQHHLGARRLECLTDEANAASRRVAEGAGFALEGILRNECADPDGTLRHTCIYAMTQ